jgi:hypothetical protein
MFVVVFDPVAGGPLFVKVEDRDEHTWAVTKTHCAKALIVCATKEKAREVLGKMFGTGMHGWWTDNGGRFDTRYGTREQVDALIQSTGVRDIWDGEQLGRWET